MTAFLTSAAILAVFFYVGKIVHIFFKKQEDEKTSFLLYPVVGFSTLVILTNIINRAGIPVRYISWLIAGLLIFVACPLLAKKFGIRAISFDFIWIIALSSLSLVFAWPILRYGFNWLSYVNDDMNNYVLGAERFVNFGFDVPPNQEFFDGRDYSQTYYFFHSSQGVRSGSEHLLALISGGQSRQVLPVFMPTILALHMSLSSASLALISPYSKKQKIIAAIGIILVAISPLFIVGTLYQLIGQVGGLSIAVALVIVFDKLFKTVGKFKSHHVCILTILIIAEFIWYPEMLPFIVLPVLIHIALRLSKSDSRQKIAQSFFHNKKSISLIVIATLLILNKNLYIALRFLLYQIGSTSDVTSQNKVELFPYFLKPHGLTSLFGFTSISRPLVPQVENFLIIVSILLVLLSIVYAGKKSFELNLVPLTYLVMLAIYFYLVFTKNGFGSFKIALYMQPFLLAVIYMMLSKVWDMISKKSRFMSRGLQKSAYLVVVFVCFSVLFSTTQLYAYASLGTSRQGFSEVPFASSSKIQSQISELLETSSKLGPIISATSNLSLIKLEAIAAKGHPILFSSQDPFKGIYGKYVPRRGLIERLEVKFPNGDKPAVFEQVKGALPIKDVTPMYLIADNKFNSVNKYWASDSIMKWKYQVVRSPENYLMFIDSSQGPIYSNFDASQSTSTFFQSESNPMIPGTFTQAIGNFLLFQILEPSKQNFLDLNISSTVLEQYNRRLPIIKLVGKNSTTFKPEGRGSLHARIPMVEPITINGLHYFAIVLDQKLLPFDKPATFAEKLYGSDVNWDSRRISTYASNISVVNESKLESGSAPKKLSKFPKDLVNKHLYYSGIYEDGWISSSSYFDLNSNGSKAFVLKGFIPEVKGNSNYRSSLSIKIGEKVEIFQSLSPGTFSIEIPIDNFVSKSPLTRVSLKFNNSLKLPKPDGRPSSAFITSLGFDN